MVTQVMVLFQVCWRVPWAPMEFGLQEARGCPRLTVLLLHLAAAAAAAATVQPTKEAARNHKALADGGFIASVFLSSPPSDGKRPSCFDGLNLGRNVEFHGSWK